jgi:hypothetical protein
VTWIRSEVSRLVRDRPHFYTALNAERTCNVPNEMNLDELSDRVGTPETLARSEAKVGTGAMGRQR